MVDGSGTETGHIIVTTIGGKNGQPKQVISMSWFSYAILYNLLCVKDYDLLIV